MAFNLGDIFVTFKAKTDDLKAGVNQVKSLTQEAERTVNNTSFKQFAGQASTAFGGVANAIQGVVVKAAVLATTSSLGIGTFVKSAADLQQTSKSFEVLTGNVEVANKLFAQLAKYANSTPFEFPDIAKAGQILLGFGIKAEDVYKRVTMLGDIAAATGADFTSLALVFGQVNATGHLMGQDALQLINNKIPITSILAKKLGITVQEVRQRMEEGAIGVDLFNTALEEATQKGGFAFHGTDILAQSLNGRLSTLKDTALEAGRNLLGVKVDPELGLTIKPGGLFDRISNLVPKISENLTALGPKLEKAFEFIMNHGDEVKMIVGGIAGAFIAAKLAAIGFAIVAAVNPITLIAAGIVAFIGLLTALQIKYDWIGKLVDRFGDNVKRAMDSIKPYVQAAADGAEDLWKWYNSLGDSAKILISPLGALISYLINIKGNMSTLAADVMKLWDAFRNSTIVTILVQYFQQVFLPALMAIGAAIWQNLFPALQQLWDAVTRLWNALNPALTTALMIIGAIIGGVLLAALWLLMGALNIAIQIFSAVVSVISNLINWVANLIAWFGNLVGVVINTVGTIITIFSNIIPAFWAVISAIGGIIAWGVGNLIGIFGRLIGGVAGILGQVVGWFAGLPGRLVSALGGVAGALQAPFSAGFNAIKNLWNNTVGRINFKVPDWVPGIGGKGWSFPQFASGVENFGGGWAVVGEKGPELAYLPRGTSVFSNEKSQGMGGKTTNIYGNINIDSEQDADYFFKRLDRDIQLQQMGVSPTMGGA